MNTEKIFMDAKNPDIGDAEKAGKILRNGGIVAFPTETVYGLGASAFDEDAVKKVFEAKGRPNDNPLIVHIADFDDIKPLVSDLPQAAEKVMKNFMPGPISMVLKKSSLIPNAVSAGLDTVAVRMPENAAARAIIRAAGVPVAAPSANTSGKPSPTEAKHVIADLDGKIDMIVDAGACSVGVESTVLDLTSDIPTVLRPGKITAPMLERVLGKVNAPDSITTPDSETPKCPGMKYKHYAPKARVVIIEYTKLETMTEELKKLIWAEQRSGAMAAVMSDGACDYSFADAVLLCGSSPDEYAKNLFKTLRDFDEIGADVVFAPLCWTSPVMSAVRNRIYKAAANNIIRL